MEVEIATPNIMIRSPLFISIAPADFIGQGAYLVFQSWEAKRMVSTKKVEKKTVNGREPKKTISPRRRSLTQRGLSGVKGSGEGFISVTELADWAWLT
jgi:hypothetical protein